MPEPMDRPAVLPLTDEQLGQWRGAISQAREARERASRWWAANLRAYAPDGNSSPDEYGTNINTNRDFTLVERKKSDLWYQRPDVVAAPSPLLMDQPDLLDVHTKILDEKLGPDGIDAESLADRVLFDVLCPSGTGWTIMGYEAATVDTPMDVPDGDTLMPGTVLGLQPVPQMKTVMAPVPIYQECFWSHLSPKQGLAPHNARTTDSDRWPWIGYEFELPIKILQRKGWVPADWRGGPSSTELHFDHGGPTGTDSVVRGVWIIYQSALYRDDRPHPKHQTELVLIDGLDAPALHQDSPYQTIDPATGALTPTSLLGYRIHPCTIRVLTDSAYVPSDCTMTRPIVNELNRFREQMLENRDANILRWMYSVDRLPPDALSKIVRSPVGGMIGVPEEAFSGEGAIKELPHGSYPRENFTINDYLDNDLARTHALDSNQQGVTASSGTTATEAQIQQQNVNARLGRERGRFLQWYLKGYTKYSSIVQRYLPVEDAAKIVGPQAAQQWDAWRKQIPASLAFTAMPDSSQRTDLAADRQRAMQEYTFFASDPYINRVELLKQLLPKLRYTSKVIQTEPPSKGPEPGKHTLTLKGDDLSPLSPQFAIIMEILKQDGLQISPQAIAEAQATAQNAILAAQVPSAPTGLGTPKPNDQHGGKLPQMESLSKHAADLTGGMQGTGQPAPMGPGGTLQ